MVFEMKLVSALRRILERFNVDFSSNNVNKPILDIL